MNSGLLGTNRQSIIPEIQFVCVCACFDSVQVRDDYGKLMHLVDGRDAFQSNWLRYVKCGRSASDQNIRAVQYDGNIYYMATKEIEIGEELLAFYGEKFARILGIKTPKKGTSKEKGT